MKRLFVSLLAVAAMASCSKNESLIAPDVPTDGVEIMAKSVTRAIESKAPFEGTIGENESLTARVLVSTTSGTYTAPYKDGTMTFTDNGTTQVGFNTSSAYYPADGSDVYLCGLYPATGWAENQTVEASYTFDGKTDVMAAAEQSSNKTAAQAGTYPKMEFKHLLTKLVIKVVAEDQAAIDAWGNVTEIVLATANELKPYTKATVTLATGAAATDGGFTVLAANTFPCYTLTGDVYNDDAFTGQTCALTTTAANAAYSLVAPIVADGTKDFELKVTTQKGVETALENVVPINLKDVAGTAAFAGDTQGKSFEITLKFKATEIQALATVAPWEEGGSAGADIQ